MSGAPLYAGANQPARRGFEVYDVEIDGQRVPVASRDVLETPFYVVSEFVRTDGDPGRSLLVVPPLSGHFAILLRDLVVGLIPSFRVFVAEWVNVRHVGGEHGDFELDDNIGSIVDMIRALPGGLTVVALCQAGVPSLAAAAVLEAGGDAKAPRNLVLVAAPIDPLANPTRIVHLSRSQSLAWMERFMTSEVAPEFEGRGRRVYPAAHQLAALWTYLVRRIPEGGELVRKLASDDGADPDRFPFLDGYTSIMDLDAALFLATIRSIFHDCELSSGTMRFKGEKVDLGAIRRARLLTIEGAWDDIAAPGQTSAAHRLCPAISRRARRSIVVPGCGHFSLFHGNVWRREVLPAILDFAGADSPTERRPATKRRSRKPADA